MVWEFFQMTNIPIKSKTQLIEYFAQGEKDKSQFAIGTEHERFLFHCDTRHRVSYDETHGIQHLLEHFISLGWQAILDHNNIIAVKNDGDLISITLEPGGQLELSGAPLAHLHQTARELELYETQLYPLLDRWGLIDLPLGFDPLSNRDQIPWMPKQRYRIMRDYMPKKGHLGLDMMLRTCTVQVNLDYENEQDMVKKLRVAMAIQPLIATLFASSPFKDGYFSGVNSYRNCVWQDTDPDRCGFLKFVFKESMGYERYVDYLLDVPMYFVYRNGQYINAAGLSFRSFMEGNLEAYPHQEPIMTDWIDQTTIAFPEVRLKQFLELRAADCGPKPMLLALPALWVGLLYDEHNLNELHNVIMNWPIGELETLYKQAPRTGLNTFFLAKPLIDYLISFVEMAKEGLKRRNILQGDSHSLDTEARYLKPLEVLLHNRMNLSDYLQAYYRQHESADFLLNKHFWREVEDWLQEI